MDEITTIAVAPNQHQPRIFHSKQQKKDFIKEFEQAGMSVKAFCEQHGLSAGTFSKWRSRYKGHANRQAGQSTKRIKASGFAELQITPPPVKADASAGAAVTSVLFAEVNGIKIYQPVAASYLKELLR